MLLNFVSFIRKRPGSSYLKGLSSEVKLKGGRGDKNKCVLRVYLSENMHKMISSLVMLFTTEQNFDYAK